MAGHIKLVLWGCFGSDAFPFPSLISLTCVRLPVSVSLWTFALSSRLIFSKVTLLHMFPEKERKKRKATALRSANSLPTCDICGKHLARWSDMPRHKRLHDPKPDRWLHWCPEPGCDYRSMQRSNLRNHIRKHTGQRLHCPDDSTCNYSTFDKSALLRHRQRKHGYQAKSTASKDRRIKVAKNRASSSGRPDNPSFDNSSTSPSEPVTDSCCPCFSQSASKRCARGAIDERDIWQDDDHAPPQAAATTEQPFESIERSLEEHVTSRFPVSFARTRLPCATVNGALPASKHRRRCKCNLRSNNPVPATYPEGTGTDIVSQSHKGAKVREVVIYRRVGCLVKESVFLAAC
ncbi:hypothetical protein BJV74DRAFT_281831 [Russula compacta]|nr:hypothetical protein BJV74DRAFT_281831 [Russula compacta]